MDPLDRGSQQQGRVYGQAPHGQKEVLLDHGHGGLGVRLRSHGEDYIDQFLFALVLNTHDALQGPFLFKPPEDDPGFYLMSQFIRKGGITFPFGYPWTFASSSAIFFFDSRSAIR